MNGQLETLTVEEMPKSATRIFLEGTAIAAFFALMTVVVGVVSMFLTGGMYDPEARQFFGGFMSSDRFGPLGIFVFILVNVWTWWFWRIMGCVREFKALPPEEWKASPERLTELFRQIHDIPYRAGFSSFLMWLVGGVIAIWFFRDLPGFMRWLVPLIAVSAGLSINLPQMYTLKFLVRPVENEIRRLNPDISIAALERRNSIGRKLRAGLIGLLALTLGVSFLISFLLVERYRLIDRKDRLTNQMVLYQDWLSRMNISDATPEEMDRWMGPLKEFRTSSHGGAILYDLDTSRFLVNVPGAPETKETIDLMLASDQQFTDDYINGFTYRSLPPDLFDRYGLSGRYRLVLAEHYVLGSGGFLRNSLLVYGIFFAMALLISYYLSRDIIVPLRELLRYTKRMGQGRLNRRRPFVAGDELGELAEETAQTASNIAAIVTDIRTVGGSVNDAARAVAGRSVSLSQASRDQLHQAENTARSIDLLASRLEGSKQEIDRLEEAVSASSSAAIEMHASAQQVNQTTTQLAVETENIKNASGKMVEATEHVANRLADLESYTDQTVSAVQLIEDRIRALRKDASLSEQLSSDALANSQVGRDALAATVQSIASGRQLVIETAQIIVSLRNRNRAINEIIETIRSVASRTTLLSLNASILAAQAGEHGASFQVVAEEIRQLATGTNTKAREIAELIETIQVETENAAQAIEQVTVQADENVSLAEGTSRVLDEITRKAESSLSVVERTTRAIEDQSRSAGEITEIVKQLGELVREFSQLGESQRTMGGRIAAGIEQVREHVLRVSRASSEQVRASGQVTDGVETVTHTLQNVLRTLNEEIGSTGDIRKSSGLVRDTATSSSHQSEELVRVSRELERFAELLQKDVDRFRIEDS